MRELLEEAQDRLLQNTPHRPGTCVECDNNRSTIAKITAALAAPEPDAMEIVVLRAIDNIAGKLDEAISSEDWNEAKSVLNDLWDLRDDKHGVKVEDAKWKYEAPCNVK